MDKNWELAAGLAILVIAAYVILGKKDETYGGVVGKYGPDGTLGPLKPGETGIVFDNPDYIHGGGASGSWDNTPLMTGGAQEKPLLL